MRWSTLASRVLAGEAATADEALAVLSSSDEELLGLLGAVFRIRLRHHGRDVRLHVLRNAKSGLSRAAGGGRRHPVQPQPRIVSPVLSPDLLDPFLRGAGRDGAARADGLGFRLAELVET
jgi:hypothetical protein